MFHFWCPVPVQVRTNEQTYRETGNREIEVLGVASWKPATCASLVCGRRRGADCRCDKKGKNDDLGYEAAVVKGNWNGTWRAGTNHHCSMCVHVNVCRGDCEDESSERCGSHGHNLSGRGLDALGSKRRENRAPYETEAPEQLSDSCPGDVELRLPASTRRSETMGQERNQQK
jgi:hypothetical protein